MHLSLILLLALLVVGDGLTHGGGIALEVQQAGGGDELDGGALEDAISMPSELAEQAIEAPQVEPVEAVTEPMEALTKIEMAELSLPAATAESLARNIGAGLGAADASGPGEADTDDDSIALGPVRTGVFGLADEGTDFVYVFDRSESMNSVLTFTSEGQAVFSITPLDAAKAELLKSLKDLKANNHFGMVFYNHSPWLFTLGRKAHGMIAATSTNKSRAAAFVASMYGQGKTFHLKPLEIALTMRPDVIFLMTDGEEKDDPTPEQLAQLKRLNDGRTKINVVQFVFQPRSGGTLVDLAKENGGKHIYFNISQLGPNAIQAGQMPVPVATP